MFCPARSAGAQRDVCKALTGSRRPFRDIHLWESSRLVFLSLGESMSSPPTVFRMDTALQRSGFLRDSLFPLLPAPHMHRL